ncbi:hypothetical protein [Micromonospora sp. DT229]|uniref:hypothetical protein n=1 Tax=Micromonospora sp. DT229 TaxID=3393430 RepID=UPI003CE6725D
MKKSAKRIGVLVSASVMAISGSLVVAAAPASAASCEAGLGLPWKAVDGRIYTSGRMFGDGCQSGDFIISLDKKVGGVWRSQAKSKPFKRNGSGAASAPCSSGTWSASILRSGVVVLSTGDAKITC